MATDFHTTWKQLTIIDISYKWKDKETRTVLTIRSGAICYAIRTCFLKNPVHDRIAWSYVGDLFLIHRIVLYSQTVKSNFLFYTLGSFYNK